MTTKHTPGPWEFTEESDCEREIVSDGPELYALATVRHGDPDQCKANAQLMAAAPALLAALESIERTTRGLMSKESENAIARAAIRKATGEPL